MVGLGAFVTTLCQPKVIGRLPFQFLLKEQLHFNQETMAVFWLWATFAWNIKPIAGVLSDAFPLFGHAPPSLYDHQLCNGGNQLDRARPCAANLRAVADSCLYRQHVPGRGEHCLWAD